MRVSIRRSETAAHDGGTQARRAYERGVVVHPLVRPAPELLALQRMIESSPRTAPIIQAKRRGCGCPGGAQASDCEICKSTALQRRASGPAVSGAPPIVDTVLRSPGSPLDGDTRQFMASRFGQDFEQVRIHDGALAAESARAVHARAFTVGQDIVFASGEYDPRSTAGRHLLAHELTHTIQQSGVGRTALERAAVGGADSQFEREADAAADAVISEGRTEGLELSRSSGAMLSRASASGLNDKARKWRSLSSSESRLKKMGVTGVHISQDQNVAAFRIDVLELPPEKGGDVARNRWQAIAAAGRLEAIVGPNGTALKQESVDTKEKRLRWLEKVGLANDPAGAAVLWGVLKGDKSESFEPRVKGYACDIDHIVELQFGGVNTAENFQCLNYSENRSSGSTLRGELAWYTQEIVATPGFEHLEEVILHFDAVSKGKGICGKCCMIGEEIEGMSRDERAKKIAEGRKTGKSKRDAPRAGEGTGEPAKMRRLTAASETAVELTGETTIALAGSTSVRNRSAATLISGLELESLLLRKRGGDKVDARPKAGPNGLPVALKGKGKRAPAFTLEAQGEPGKLKFVEPTEEIRFTYPYLSEAVVTRLELTPAGLAGEAMLTPSAAFLRNLRLGVRFGPDLLEVFGRIDPKRLTPPIPGAEIKNVELSLALFPEFTPEGRLDFGYSLGTRRLFDAAIRVGKDNHGLSAAGTLRAHVPGVEKAAGTIRYSANEWSGVARAESSDISLPYVKGGFVEVGFDANGVRGGGEVQLELPGGTARVSLVRRERKWVFEGDGRIKVPGLSEVAVRVQCDDEELRAEGVAGFEALGAAGELSVVYVAKRGGKARVSGRGRLPFKKGRASGALDVTLNPEGKLTGEGELSYRLSENLVATVGASLDEKQKVRLRGALEFPRPIRLFDAIEGDFKLFSAALKIPIPGVSVGTIGVVAALIGTLRAGYAIGPGELQGVRLAVAGDPLEPRPELDVQLRGMLVVPSSVRLQGNIRGAIAVDLAVGSLSGGLVVLMAAELAGKLESPVDVRYRKSRFELVALAELSTALVLSLGLGADVTAVAGVEGLGVSVEKFWKLVGYKFDTGVKLGMKAKLEYASDRPFKAPSPGDIEWTVPKLDLGAMLARLMAGTAVERESA